MSTFHGRFPLGQKTDSVQEPGLLGDEHDDVVFTHDTNTGMTYNVNSGRVRKKWVKNTGGSALEPGSVVAWDTGDSMDINVIQCTSAMVPCGIVDPYLTEDVADGESFNMIIKANRIKALAGGNFTKGNALSVADDGEVVVGSGSFIRAIATNADGAGELVDVACDFSSVGPDSVGVARLLRARVAIAAINTPSVLLPALPGYAYRMHSVTLMAEGGAAATATAVTITATQSASPVDLLTAAVASLGDDVPYTPSTAVYLANGLGLSTNDVNTAIGISKTGGTLGGCTHVNVFMTYELVAA